MTLRMFYLSAPLNDAVTLEYIIVPYSEAFPSGLSLGASALRPDKERRQVSLLDGSTTSYCCGTRLPSWLQSDYGMTSNEDDSIHW